ncbi:hypothetical protein CEXT_493611 [Caerostris extrusa]|uniref:Uncharacterized protein n=1 Tax=Caerostris extrusa TaxID=172846 RepID=A0AAV4SA50_CAEEX|nr:hypothetical protein CEXT_493611 [Caerostris extrusa]
MMDLYDNNECKLAMFVNRNPLMQEMHESPHAGNLAAHRIEQILNGVYEYSILCGFNSTPEFINLPDCRVVVDQSFGAINQ